MPLTLFFALDYEVNEISKDKNLTFGLNIEDYFVSIDISGENT